MVSSFWITTGKKEEGHRSPTGEGEAGFVHATPAQVPRQKGGELDRRSIRGVVGDGGDRQIAQLVGGVEVGDALSDEVGDIPFGETLCGLSGEYDLIGGPEGLWFPCRISNVNVSKNVLSANAIVPIRVVKSSIRSRLHVGRKRMVVSTSGNERSISGPTSGESIALLSSHLFSPVASVI